MGFLLCILWVHPRLQADLYAGLIGKCNELLSTYEKQHNPPPPPLPPPCLAGSDLPMRGGNRKGLEVTSVDSESWLMRLWRADASLSAVKSQPTRQSQSVGSVASQSSPPPRPTPPLPNLSMAGVHDDAGGTCRTVSGYCKGGWGGVTQYQSKFPTHAACIVLKIES